MLMECYPVASVPGTTALFRDYAEARAGGELPEATRNILRSWYPTDPFSMGWSKHAPAHGAEHLDRLANELSAEVRSFGGGEAALGHVERLRAGAAAVVTGQQVGLFGGPMLTLLKAATAIRKAKDATRASGREHVPVFWLATEDHDLPEVDQVALPANKDVETLHLSLHAERPVPVGTLRLDGGTAEGRAQLEAALDHVSDLLGWAPACEALRECYAPADGKAQTLATAFGRWLTRVFAAEGLIVMDAASRSFHAPGRGGAAGGDRASR